MLSKLRNIFQRSNPLENPAISLDSPEAYETFCNNSSSGVSINYNALMGFPAIRRAINLICNPVAKLPINVYPRKTRDKDTSHPAYKLLNLSPSPLYTPFTFRKTMEQYKKLYGMGCAYIFRDEFGTPTQLLILDPETTHCKVSQQLLGDTPTTDVVYETLINGKQWIIAPEDVLCIKDFGDGFCGDKLMEIAKDFMGGAIALQKYGNVFFKNNAKPCVIVELPPTAKDRAKAEQFRAEWYSMHAGVNNAHRTGFVASGSKVNVLGGDNENSQFIQSKEHMLIEVALLLNVPPHKVGSSINSSYGSLEQENMAFLSDTLDPELIDWEQEITCKLLTENEKKNCSRYVEADRKALITIDAKTEADLITGYFNNGLLSWEESRAKLNLNCEKDDEQEWRHPSNIVIEGEEPVEPPQAPVDAPMPMEEPKAEETPVEDPLPERMQEQTKGIINRWLTRCLKSCEAGKTEIELHRDILIDHLKAFPNAEVFTDKLIERLQSEVNNVLPEQYNYIFSQEVEMEQLWS